jgi:hypothetical protein
MSPTTDPSPQRTKSPARVAAGKRNRLLRGPTTLQGRQQLSEAAHLHRPSRHSTGPRTPEGKAKSSNNGRWRQVGRMSKRQAIRELAPGRALIAKFKQLADQLLDRSGGRGSERPGHWPPADKDPTS